MRLHYRDTFGMKLWYQGVYRDEGVPLSLGTKIIIWYVLIKEMPVTPDDNLTAECVEMPRRARLRNIACTAVSEYAPFTYALRLSNLENSNVQHGFSGNYINYQSLEQDYWDRYNSTGNTSCHMILGPLMYIPTNINLVK